MSHSSVSGVVYNYLSCLILILIGPTDGIFLLALILCEDVEQQKSLPDLKWRRKMLASPDMDNIVCFGFYWEGNLALMENPLNAEDDQLTATLLWNMLLCFKKASIL